MAHIVVLIGRQVAAFSRALNWKKRIEGMPYWRGKSILHLGVRWVMLATAVQFAFYAHPLFANPVGASVVNGAVNMQTTGNTLAITASDRSIINWQGFSIGAGETTQFIQPTVNASVLNRVTSGDASQIMGALQANGQVYLINPNGVFIGNGATINVGSFLASTANVSDESFMRGGNLTFAEATGAGIVNRGTITANHGDVFLLAKTVENSGTIQAAQGTVGLMAGTQFFLKKDETGAVKVKVDSTSVAGVKVGTGVANSGVIEAMQAQLEAQGNVYALAINQSGIIRATGVSRDASGTIVLSAPGGMIRNTGTMLALNRDGSGGRLSISGQDVSLSDLSILTAAGTGGSEAAVGGQIEIAAVEDAIVAGRLDVTAGGSAKGGRMVVTGRRVGVFGGKLDASGGTGGGEILLGGDYQGMNPLVRNAERAYVSQDSIISADATVAGDGGKIINWSDNGTQFYGSATAKGGAVSGNGGFVEVSGRDFLDYFGSVNTLAPNGQTGMLLLDPTNLNINNSSDTAGMTGPAFVTPATPSPANLSWASIASSLQTSAVTISTASAAADTGTITINGPATGANALNSANSITMNAAAGGSIIVSSDITNTGTGALIFNTSGAGVVTVNANITLGGNFNATSASTVTLNNAISGAAITLTSSAAGIVIGSGGDITATGNVAISGSTGISTAGDITTSGSNVTYTGAVTLTGAGINVSTSGGNISFSSTINGTVAGSQALALTAGTGAVGITGIVGGGTQIGALTVNSASSFSNAAAITVNGANNITIFADALTIGAALTTTSGNIQIAPSTLTKNIALNNAAGATELNLGATLANFVTTGGKVILGRDDMTGSILVGSVGATSISNLNLNFLTSSSGQTVFNNSFTLATGSKYLEFDSAVKLATTGGTTTFATSNGNITFDQALDADGISTGNMTIAAGTGTTSLNGTVGSGARLGAISFTTAGTVTFDSSVAAASLAAAGGAAVTTATFNGSQNYNAAAGLNFVADSIVLNGAVTTATGSPVVTLNADTGTLTINATGDIISQGAVSLTGAGGITTSGDITGTASGATITFASATTLGAGTVTLGTQNSAITFSSTLGSASAGNISLSSGTANITFSSTVGGGGNTLGNIAVTSVGTLTAPAISAASFTQTGGASSTVTQLTGAQNYSGNFSVTSNGSFSLGAGASLNTTVAGASGTVTLAANTVSLSSTSDITAGGTVSIGTAAGTVSTGGDVTTSADDITFVGATTLSSAVALSSTGGNVAFSRALTGNQDLSIAAGTGTVTFTGAVSNLGDGVGAALTIGSASSASFASTFGANSGINSSATANTFSGDVTLANGDTASTFANAVTLAGITWSGFDGLTVTGAATLSTGAVSINSNAGNISFGSTLAGGSQDLTIAAGTGAGTTTFSGAISAIGDGVGAAITLASTGLVTFSSTVGGNSGIVSSNAGGSTRFNDNVTLANGDTASSFAGAVTMDGLTWSGFDGLTVTGAATLSTGAVSINSNAGNILFGSTLAGGSQDLTIAAGTGAGTTTFSGAISAIGDGVGAAITLASTGLVTFNGTVAGNSGIVSSNAGGSTRFNDDVTLTNGDTGSSFVGAVTMDGLTWSGFDGFTTTAVTGILNVLNATTITSNDANITLNGTVSGVGKDLTLTAGTATATVASTMSIANLTVTADEIDFSGGASTITSTGAVLLQGATAATTIGVGGGAGDLDLNDTDLAAIADGATSITIGQALQTGLVTVDTSAFRDPVTIRSSGTLGEVQVDGLITATGATTSVTLEGATLDLNAGIDTAGGAVTLTGGIGGVDLAAVQTIDTAAGANSGTDSGDVTITATGTGTITLAGDLLTTGASNNAGVGSAAGAITITGVNGNVAITGNISALGGASSAGAGGAGGDLSITTSTGTIGLANIDTSGGASTLNNSNGGDAGAITINSSGGLSVTLNSSTISASGGAAGGGTGLVGDGANITFNNPVILATGASTITTTGNTGGDIAFNNTVSGTFDLTLASGNGDIAFADDVGSGVLDPLGIVTVNSVNAFLSTSTFEAAQFVLATTSPLTGVTFSGGLNLSTSLTTIAGSYGFSITGASNSIAGDTNFRNQGALVLGNDALDVLTFVGGLATTGNVTNPSGVSLAGTINTTDTQMDLGAVTLTAATTLDTGNNAAGVLNVGAVTSGGNSLTLDSGSTAGATISMGTMADLSGGLTIRDAGGLATIGALGSGTAGALTITDSTSGVTFNSTVNATSVTVSDSTAGATISFLGNLTATSMTAAGTANAYNISITGAANTITGASTFANTGTLTLGNGGDAIAFTGGVTATAPSSINLNGNITAAGTGVINLGAAAVAVGGSSTVGGTSTGAITVGNATLADGVTLTVGTGIANAITLGTVTGTAAGTVSNLTINTTGVVTVGGAIGTDIGTVTLTQSGGATFAAVSAANVVVTDTADNATVSFGGNLNVTTGMTIGANGAYNVSMTGAANTIEGITAFNNTGVLTLGNGGDTLAFTGGVTATAPSSKDINGNITAAGTGVINLGNTPVTVSGNSTVGGTSTGAITLGNATLADGVTLTIGTGIANTISLGSITGTAAGAVSDLTLDTTGAVTVAGAVNTDIGTITITQSGGVAFQSTVTANTVTISDSTAGADVAFQGNLTVNTGMSAAAGTAAYDVLITGSSNSIANNTTFSNTGQLTIGNAANDVTVFTGGLTATTQSAGFGAGFVRTAGGVVDLGGVTFTAASTIDTTNDGAVAAGANLTLANALGGQNLTLVGGTGGTVDLGGATVANLTVTSNAIDFSGGADSITSTGNVLLQGATAATTIDVGSPVGGTGLLDITDTDLAAITDGATSITIGQSAQTGLITVGTSSFRDSVVIRSSGTLGEVQVDGLITATGATTSVTLQGATLDLNAGITTAGGAVTLTGGAGGVDLAAGQTILTTAAAGTASGAVAVTATGAGTINLAGAITTTGAGNNLGAGSAGGNVTITGATGTVTVSGAVTATGGAGTRAFVAGGENGGAGGDIAISATTGNVSVTGAVNTLGGVASNGEGGTGGDLALSTTTGTIGLGNINTSGGTSTTTNFDGGDAGAITLSSTGGSAVTLNNSTVSALGGTAGGGIGVAGNGAAITFNNPVLLATGAVSISTTGANGGNITFNSTVNSSSSLTPQSMTLTAGTGTQAGTVTFAGIVGGTAALTDLDVTAKTIQLNTTSISVDAGAGGNTVSLTGAVILGANVSLDLDGALGNNDLLVTGTVDSASSLVARNLTVLAGASNDGILTLGDVTVTGAVGGIAPLGNITVSGAGTLTSGTTVADNVSFTGDLTATANEMFFNGTEVRSTGAGTITFAPTTAGRGILVTGTATVDATRLVLDTLSSIYTAGRLVIGSATSGVVSVETLDLSGNSFSGFSFLSGDFDVTFAADRLLTLPTGTDIRFQLGSGDVNGLAELNSTSLSPNLVSAGGTLSFVSVGSVSLYGSVANLETSNSTGATGGLVYLNEGTLNVIGNQTTAGQMLIGSVNGDLNLSSQLTGTKITAYADGNFNNTFGSTAINLQGGRGLVYSTSPNDNTPNSANGGLTGFGAAYLVPTPDVLFPTVGTYTISNPPAGSANLMAYSDPLPGSQLDAATLNQIVQTDAYLAAVPLTGASLPALPRSDVRLGFRAGAPQQRAPAVNPLGKVEKGSDTKGQSADVGTPGRLKVSQVKRAGEDKGAGQTVRSEQKVQPIIRIGSVTLRPSGDYLPAELAEVTMGGIKISQK